MVEGAIHHLAVVVKSLARAEHFYASVVGLRVIERRMDDDGYPRAIWLELGAVSTAGGAGAFLALEKARVEAPTRVDEAPGWHCVAFAIARGERERWRERLQRAGHRVERESPFSIYTRDPDGNLVAFSHYPEAAS